MPCYSYIGDPKRDPNLETSRKSKDPSPRDTKKAFSLRIDTRSPELIDLKLKRDPLHDFRFWIHCACLLHCIAERVARVVV